MGFVIQKEYAIIKKHFMMILYILAKFVFLLAIAAAVFIITYLYQDMFGHDMVAYFLFPLTIILINYAFIKLSLWLIFYYNDLVIFVRDKIIIVKSSLFMQDDLEIIDVSKVMKIDVQCHWIFANLLWYWNLVIEQQRDELRILHFIPKPYKTLQLLREKTAYLNIWQDMSFFKLN